ncbi:MAG: class C sortase [Enterococcus sp.]
MKIYKILFPILVFIGIGLLSYPFISNFFSGIQEEKVISEYEKNFDKYSKEDSEREISLARAYNDSISGEKIKDPFIQNSGASIPDNYMSILNFDGVMATIEIPKIKVRLPIYHGTSEKVLQKGAGHLVQSSFPVGGESSHAVISAHRGLPNAKFFTDIVKLKKKDRFFINVMNETLCYEIDQIKKVEPNETEDLLPIINEDYVTLVTCVPYGVNSHRLLVRGKRAPYSKKHSEEVKVNNDRPKTYFGILLFGLIITVVIFVYKKKKRKV